MTRAGILPQGWVLVFGLAFAAACSAENGARDEVSRQLDRRVSTLSPVAWAEHHVLFFWRFDQFIASAGGSGRVACDSTGLYTVEIGSKATPWKVGEQICNVLWSVDRIQMSHDRSALLYSDRLEAGGVSRLDVDQLSRTPLVQYCLPFGAGPSWSPDERTIAFVGDCVGSDRLALHLANADGSAARPVGSPSGSAREEYPSWAPDGSHIAVARRRTSMESWESEIVVVDTMMGERRALTRGYAPAWSPTSEWIAYLRQDSSHTSPPSIRLIHPDTSGDRELLRGGLAGVEAAGQSERWVSGPLVWSPDGSRLAFSRGASIWVISVDGSGLEAVVPVAR
ncbi:MAG: hypothetical protein GTO22_21400 [Gemmatimonadales bacterium]|nr:hypothetical protein [Gemmatimonadales bacterium]